MSHRLRSLVASVVAFGVPLAIYVASLRWGVDYWDTGELQTVPVILGIAHPSGFPAYVMLGWVWSHVVPAGDPAYRMNLLSAVGMSIASLAAARCAMELDVEPLLAGATALVFALTRVPWEHATHADVHALALAATGTGFWCALRWKRTGAPVMLVAAAVAAGLALGVHSGTILVVPGIALVVLARRPAVRTALRAAAITAAMTLAAYAYLPIRSAIVTAQRLDPTLALGLPPGRPFWDSDHPASWPGFWAEVGGGDFGTGHALARLADPHVLAELPARFGEAALGDLAAGIIIIALIGLGLLARRSPAVAGGFAVAALLPVLFVLAYPAESDPERYYLPAYWAIAVAIAFGADALARGGVARGGDARMPRAVFAIMTVVFVAVAGGDAYAGRGAFSARQRDSAQAFIDRTIRETPNDAVLVAPWMYATPLAYAAYVEHRLGKRIVVTAWPEDDAAYYPRWIAERPVVFITDDPTISVSTVRVVEPDPLTPAPHFFVARPLP